MSRALLKALDDAIKGVSKVRTLPDDLRLFASANTRSLEEVTKLVRSFDSGIKSLDDAIRLASVTKTNSGVILVGNTTVGDFRHALKSANLDRVLGVLGRTDIPNTSTDRETFATIVGSTLERALDKLDISVKIKNINKSNFPELNVSAEAADTISDTGKKNETIIESNLYEYLKQDRTIALTVGVVTVAGGWLMKATAKRRGCLMFTNLDGNITSCKISSFTCTDDSALSGRLCDSDSTLFYYNTTLVLMHLAQLKDTDVQKIEVARVACVSMSEFEKQLPRLLETKYAQLAKYVEKMGQRPVLQPCSQKLLNPNIENGIIPFCRMCSSTANPISTEFIDPIQYTTNITFKCITNPTILDTIIDVISSTGKNILTNIKSTMSGSLKTIGIIATIVLVLIVRVLPKRTPDNDVVPVNIQPTVYTR
uniref:ODV-E56 n=1 Tax=Nilaparvata lugens endogenous nudivirus TaxID=1487700 RepID=X5G6Q7_9VIRU|nr:ODV-E56 [Nilaparvata lugens endogenous nudivirus]